MGTESEARTSKKKRAVILGGGPNRIGQGIEALVKKDLGVMSLQEYHKKVKSHNNGKDKYKNK